MKKILGLLLGLGLAFTVATQARASEGQAILEPTTPGGPKCLVASVFIDRNYQLLLTCRNLITPYSAEITRYVFWAYNPEQKRWTSLGRVNQGKLATSTNFKFTELQVTAEEGSPREPSERIVVKGAVAPFDFDKAAAPILTATKTPTPIITGVVTPIPQGNVVGGVVRSIAKFLVIGFVVLLVAVVVLTFISRRKEL